MLWFVLVLCWCCILSLCGRLYCCGRGAFGLVATNTGFAEAKISVARCTFTLAVAIIVLAEAKISVGTGIFTLAEA